MKHIYAVLFFALTLTSFSQELASYVDFGASSPQVQKSRIALDAEGNVIHANYIDDYLDANPGAGVEMVNPNGAYGIVITKFDPDLNFLWARFFEFTSYYWMDVECDAAGNIYFGGILSGTSDLDPGPGYEILTSQGWGDPVFIKFTPDGDFIWASVLNSIGSDTVYDMTVLPDGSPVIVGHISGTVDFDPGPGEQIVEADEFDYFGFTCKLNPDGTLSWATGSPQSGISYLTFVTSDSDGNIISRGTFSGVADFDTGPGEYLIEATTLNSEFVAKYSSDGTLIWAFELAIGSGFSEDADLIITDTENNIIIGGLMYYSVDFDPSEGLAVTDAGYNYQGYIAKYSPDGSYIWHRSYPGMTNHNIACGDDNSIYVSSTTGSNSDADGGFGTFLINDDGLHSIGIARYSADGDFLEGFSLYTGDAFDAGDWTTNIEMRAEQIIITGLYQGSIDLDPGEGEVLLEAAPSTWPAFISVYDQNECATIGMIIDEMQSISCTDIVGLASAQFVSGTSPYTYDWNTGETTSVIYPQTSGIYTVVGTEGSGCVEENSVLINGPSFISGFDLNPNLSFQGFSPGFESYLFVDAFNDGCESVSGSFDLILDAQLTYLGAEPAPDVIVGNTLTWYFTDMYYDGAHLTPVIHVLTSVDAELDDIIDLTVSMSPAGGDSNAENNVKHYQSPVVGSFDPNDKQVYPQGDGSQGYIGNNQTMTYTIRFQNTGTAPAVNVNIIDEIHENLDLSTIQVIGSSHNMYTEVLDNNTLRFFFPEIMLPDSGSDYLGSMGYVTYTIEQDADLPYYSEITNTAAIYFDFNAPIITNTVINTIQGPDNLTETGKSFLHVYPNPVNDMLRVDAEQLNGSAYSIISADGRMILSGTFASSSPAIDCSALTAGLYQLRVQNREGVFVSQFVKQ